MRLGLLISGLLLSLCSTVCAQVAGIYAVEDHLSMMPMRDQVILMNRLLHDRQKTVLPAVMRESEIDMWIVGEGDDTLYLSLIESGPDGLVQRSRGHLIFFDRGDGGVLERLTVRSGDLAGIITARNPKAIALSESGGRGRRSRGGGGGDSGGSELQEALGEELASRIVSAGTLRNRWLGTRSDEELSIFKHVFRLTHEINKEAFSNRVITPDVTTTDDVNWWIRQRYVDLGLGTVDHPTITIQRSKAERAKYDDDDEYFAAFDARFEDDPSPMNGYNLIIRRGDVIFCDTGIKYLGLYTDTQQSGYVLREGEEEPPEGIKEALRQILRFQDLIGEEMKLGRSGSEIGNAAVERAAKEGIDASLYGHSLAYYFDRYELLGRFYSQETHGAGSGLSSGRGGGRGGNELRYNTLFAMELDIKYDIPEWGGQKLILFSETGITFTKENGLTYPGGRETEWFVIR